MTVADCLGVGWVVAELKDLLVVVHVILLHQFAVALLSKLHFGLRDLLR